MTEISVKLAMVVTVPFGSASKKIGMSETVKLTEVGSGLMKEAINEIYEKFTKEGKTLLDKKWDGQTSLEDH